MQGLFLGKNKKQKNIHTEFSFLYFEQNIWTGWTMNEGSEVIRDVNI